MWEALEQSSWVQTVAQTGWLYASISILHYLTFFWCVGSIAVIDLRVLGLAARGRTASELAEVLFPWAWTGFGLAILSGFLMFATDAGDWAPDRVFHVKLLVILLAVVATVLVQMGVPRWDASPTVPTVAKIVAAVSLLLWIGAILSASEIPALEGLG
jgi:hypothetical protein